MKHILKRFSFVIFHIALIIFQIRLLPNGSVERKRRPSRAADTFDLEHILTLQDPNARYVVSESAPSFVYNEDSGQILKYNFTTSKGLKTRIITNDDDFAIDNLGRLLFVGPLNSSDRIKIKTEMNLTLILTHDMIVVRYYEVPLRIVVNKVSVGFSCQDNKVNITCDDNYDVGWCIQSEGSHLYRINHIDILPYIQKK